MQFLHTHFHPDVVFESTTFAHGIEFLIAQWKVDTLLHRPRMTRAMEVEKIDGEGTIYRGHGQTQLTITRDAIRAFYPHIQWNARLLAQAMNKTINVNWTRTFYFDDMNRIRYLAYDVDFLLGWRQLVSDPVILANVVQFRNMNNGYARQNTLEEWVPPPQH